MKKGTPVPTKFGIFHVGDILRARLYEFARGGGTAIEEYTGELVYHEEGCRFLIRDPEPGLSYTLRLAEPPEIIKAWDAPEV